VTRRSLLALAAAIPLLAAGCAPGTKAGTHLGGLRPDGSIRACSYITPSYDDLYPALQIFNKAVDQLGGDVVDFFDSGALLNAEQTIPGLLRGVSDIAFQTTSYVSTSFPIMGVAELPFVNEGFEQMRTVLAPGAPLPRLINEQIRHQGMLDLGAMPCTTEWLFTVDRPVEKPEDLRGLRIRTAGHVEGETVKALGGSPVSISSAELYEALERGTIDGMVSYAGTVASRKLTGVLKYATQAHFGAYSVDAFANTKWYDATDQKVRDALQHAGRVYAKDGTDAQYKVYKDDYLPVVEDKLETIHLDDAQTARFRQATSQVVEWWKKKVGDPELADRALAMVREK